MTFPCWDAIHAAKTIITNAGVLLQKSFGQFYQVSLLIVGALDLLD